LHSLAALWRVLAANIFPLTLIDSAESIENPGVRFVWINRGLAMRPGKKEELRIKPPTSKHYGVPGKSGAAEELAQYSDKRLKLQVSKRTPQEWEQGRAQPEHLALAAITRLIKP
jgi:hypothetical protein